MTEDPAGEAFGYCLKILSRRDYTAAEIEEKLRSRDVSENVRSEVLRQLRDLDYVNDERFALNFARSRAESNNEGKYKIRYMLLGKGLDEGIVEKALAGLDEETDCREILKKALEKRLRIKGIPATKKELHNLEAHLSRKGFGRGEILEVTEGYRRGIFDD